MAVSVIDVGTTANDGTGDTLRAAFVKVNANEAGLAGGAGVFDETLKEWVTAEAYEVTSATLDSDQVPTTATVKWPDGSAGTFTTTTKNTTWKAVDAFTVSHTDSGKTVTQAAVTRDSNGNVTTKPALTVA